jgi:hypothetical protein
MSKLVIVRYQVEGKEYFAGPYNPDDASEHSRDIAGYEGVTNVWVDDAKSPAMPLSDELTVRLKTSLEELQAAAG